MHTFRKYISNRGSALFMVISTMTALMITCMAMYFTVLASRSTIYAVFNQKQSYQSSMSIFDFLYNDLGTSPENTLRDKMFNMSVNEEFTASGSEEQLGDYTVTITKIKDAEGGAKGGVYDIIVSSTIDGVTETVHSQINLESAPATDGGGSPSLSIAPTFAATGYVSNDVILSKGTFYSDVTFDCEVTHFGTYQKSELFVYGDINCSGSVVFEEEFQWNSRSGDGVRPITIAIRNTFTTPNANVSMGFAKGDTFLIGGDAYIGYNIKNATIYVNGDLYLSDGNYGDQTFLVNGDVYTDLGVKSNSIYCNGNIYSMDGTPKDRSGVKTWDEVVGTSVQTCDDVISRDDMINQLDKRTQTNTYYKWTIDDSPTSTDDKAVPEVNLGSTGNHQKLTVGYQPLYIVHEDAYTSSNNPYGNDSQLDSQWKKGCVIDDINVTTGGPFYIIIDTGENPDNVYTIRLQGNTDGPKGKDKYFTWNAGAGISARPIILVKGNGSVVIDVPKGLIYQDVTNGIIAHYNWWVLGGGDPTNPSDGFASANYIGDNGKFNNYVHRTCGANCKDQCYKYVGEPVDSTEKCDRETHPAGMDRTKKTVKCPVHGIEVTYCPYCEEVMVKDIDGCWNFCKDHVDKANVKAAIESKGLMDRIDKTPGGEIIYPNCNIYLISSDESSEFRFGRDPNGNPLSKNFMIGYIYAPYQTFKCDNTDEGDFLKFMGGMTVSDYNFYSKGTFLICQPDKNPAELMGDDALKHKYEVSKDWKLEFVTH